MINQTGKLLWLVLCSLQSEPYRKRIQILRTTQITGTDVVLNREPLVFWLL